MCITLIKKKDKKYESTLYHTVSFSHMCTMDMKSLFCHTLKACHVSFAFALACDATRQVDALATRSIPGVTNVVSEWVSDTVSDKRTNLIFDFLNKPVFSDVTFCVHPNRLKR